MPRPVRLKLSRRQLISVLAVAGIAGPAATRMAAEGRKQLSLDTLKNASALVDEDVTDARLPLIQHALQQHLDQFQIIRDLEIDDLVEPAVTFDPMRYY